MMTFQVVLECFVSFGVIADSRGLHFTKDISKVHVLDCTIHVRAVPPCIF